jgi:hypothetical protein
MMTGYQFIVTFLLAQAVIVSSAELGSPAFFAPTVVGTRRPMLASQRKGTVPQNAAHGVGI